MYGSFAGAIRALIPVVETIQGWKSDVLVQIGSGILDGQRSVEDLSPWVSRVFPPTFPRAQLPVHGRVVNPGRKARHRAEYGRVQRLFRSSMSRIAKEILDGATEVNGFRRQADGRSLGPVRRAGVRSCSPGSAATA